MKPFFSIVMPVWGAADFLADAVGDIRRQSETDWELVLVNDASPDDSGAIADEWAARDGRIRVVHLPENGGAAHARNVGLAQANGDYVLFLDPDDRYEPAMLSRYRQAARTTPDVIACGLREEYWQDGRECYAVIHTHPGTTAATPEAIARTAFALEAETMYGYPWNKAYRRALLKDNGLTFPDYAHDEDILFNIEVFSWAQTVVVIEDVLYRYINRSTAKERLTGRYVPTYFAGKRRRIAALYRQYRSVRSEFSDGERTQVLELLAGEYFRALLSMLERELDHGTDPRRLYRRAVRETQSAMYRRLRPYLTGGWKKRLLYAPLVHGRIAAAMLEAGLISVVRRRFAGWFTRLKQLR